MSERVVNYLIENHNIEKKEAEKVTLDCFNYIDSIVKKEGYKPFSEKSKADMTIGFFEAVKLLGKEIAKGLE